VSKVSDKAAYAGLALIRAAGDDPLSAVEHRSLTAKLAKLVEDLPVKERDLLWGEVFAEPLAMLAPLVRST
jgi:hypothetical protein